VNPLVTPNPMRSVGAVHGRVVEVEAPAAPAWTPLTASGVRNVRLMHLLERIAMRFAEERVPLMVLKGAALQLTVYERPDERPMCDLDLLVRPEDLGRVQALLDELDCLRGPEMFREDFFPRFHYELQYVSGSIQPAAIDLHARPFRLVRWSRLVPDDALWARAVRTPLGRAHVLVPGDEDMVIHLAAHSAIHGPSHGQMKWHDDIARWIARRPIDWDRLVETARAWRLALPVRRGLHRAAVTAGAAYPEDARRRLESTRAGWRDRLALAHAPRDRGHLAASAAVVLLTTPGVRFRLDYLRTILFPDRVYLDEWSLRHGRARRWWTGLARCFSPILRRLPRLGRGAIEIKRSPIHGNGVFARRDFRPGQVIARYRGRPSGSEGRYVASHDGDGGSGHHEITGPLRFLNHSCRPRAELEDFRLVALLPIRAGEEITIDYGDGSCDCAGEAWHDPALKEEET
jgi:hypothetical protein